MKIKVLVHKQPNGDYRAEIPAVPGYTMPEGATEITAIVHPGDRGGYWAEFAGLRGCFTQADDMDELKFNIREVLELYLGDGDDHELQALQPETLQVAEAVK